MIYKKFELSKSLNGDKIITIARNYAGVVVFRGETDEVVKKMIDEFLEEEKRKREKEEESEKKNNEEIKSKKEKKKLFQTLAKEARVDENEEEESILTPPTEKLPHQRVTRGPDGKFISKSKLEEQSEPEKKKSFWNKLTG